MFLKLEDEKGESLFVIDSDALVGFNYDSKSKKIELYTIAQKVTIDNSSNICVNWDSFLTQLFIVFANREVSRLLKTT